MDVPKTLVAPIEKGQEIGTVKVMLDGKVVAQRRWWRSTAVEEAGFFKRLWHELLMWWHRCKAGAGRDATPRPGCVATGRVTTEGRPSPAFRVQRGRPAAVREPGAVGPAAACPGPPGGGAGLGWARGTPIIGGMDINSDNPDHGFQFPGTFELSAMGTAEKDLETRPADPAAGRRHRGAARTGQLEAFLQRPLCLGADQPSAPRSREQYDLAHQVLRDHPEVKWTL